MKTSTKRLLSIAVALVMVLGLMPATSLQTQAAIDAVPESAKNALTAAQTRQAAAIALQDSDAFKNAAADAQIEAVCPICDSSQIWLPLSGATQGESVTGHYYVDTDITATITSGNMYTLAQGTSSSVRNVLCLLLNDHKLDGNAKARAFLINSYATLNILGTGTITNGYAAGHGGNLHNSGIINTYGATISNGVAKEYGGNIYSAGTVNLYGGIVDGGTAGVRSTEVYTNDEAQAKYIADQKTAATAYYKTGAAGYGGNIYNTSTFNMYDGTVQNGVVYTRTGNKVTLKNGSYTFETAYDSGIGGNIYTGTSDTLNMYGGLITGGKSDVSGGNLHANSSCKMNIYAGVIEHGTAGMLGNGCGGNIHGSSKCQVTIHGGTIRYGTATGTSSAAWGGNIRIWCGSLTINGGLLYGGNCVSRAGAQHGTATSAGRSRNIGIGGNVADQLLTITGGTMSSDIYVMNSKTYPGTKLVLSGTPQILKTVTTADGADKDYTASSGLLAALNSGYNGFSDASGLEAGAVVYLNTENLDGTVISENATKTTQSAFRTLNADHCVSLSDTTLTYERAHTSADVAAVPATCTETGKTAGTGCSGCGKVLSGQEEVAALGHTYGDVSFTWAADGTTATAKVTCSVCEEGTQDHELTADAAMETVGTTAGDCKTNSTVTYKATATLGGKSGEETNTVEGALGGHSYSATVTPPTCDVGGYTTYTCSVCGDTYTADTVAASGHTPAAAVIENQVTATCTEGGSYDTVIYCSVEACKHEISRVTVPVAATGHSIKLYSAEEPASCLVPGKAAVYACENENCGKFFEDAEGDVEQGSDEPGMIWPEGHDLTFVPATEADCDDAGVKAHYLCTVCNGKYENEDDFFVAEEYDTVIPALGHTEVTDAAKEPTCTEPGLTEGKHCSVCGEVLTAQEEISAPGHSYTEYVYNNDAKPGVDGTETAACDNDCGTTDTRPAAGTALPADAVAAIEGVYYPTVQEALTNAQDNQLVTLVADSDESGKVLLVMNGVTLDLNGYTLTAEYLITTSGGANVKDASNGKGLLKVAKDKLTVIDVEHLPIWIAEDAGFRFAEVQLKSYMIEKNDSGYADVGFYLGGTDPDYLLAKELADGAEDGDGLVAQMRMTYTNDKGTQSVLTFNVPAQLLKDYGAAYMTNAMHMTITGLNTISDVEFQAVISYGAACICSNVTAYTAQ